MARQNKQQEQTMTAEDVLAHLLANMPGYLYYKDREGTYLGCNNYQAQRLGCRLGKDVVGKKDTELLDNESNTRFSHNDEQVMSLGQTRIVEEEITLRNQRVILLSLKSPILGKKRRVLGMVSIALDITRERRLEEKVRLLKAANNELTSLPPSVPITHLLIVENNPKATQDLQRFFTKAGCKVEAITDPDSVLKQLKKEKYALIFMDVNLVDTSGTQILQQIRSQPGKNQTTPIIGFNQNET
jgi:CheY-like chemotaxis protein